MQERILVVDDDKKLSDLLRRGLAYEGYQVHVASDGRAALAMALQWPPDLVVLDVVLPEIDGLEVCRRLRAGGDLAILMLTARDTVADRVLGLETGADDYLIKPFAFEELLARIHALLRRREPDGRGVLRYADLSLDTASRIAQRDRRRVDLSATEFELLSLFLRRPEQVLTRDVIMERVWGYDFQGESNVLEVYVRYLRNKLESGGEQRLIHTIRGAGYVLRQG